MEQQLFTHNSNNTYFLTRERVTVQVLKSHPFDKTLKPDTDFYSNSNQ